MKIENAQRYYILVGESEAWRIGLSMNIWGFSDSTKGLWNTSNIGDYVAFYVTAPIKRIIGFGKITEKFIDNEPTWYDEKLFKTSIWKYRIKFEKYHVIENWNNGIPVPPDVMLNVGRKVITKELFCRIIKKADMKWKTALSVTTSK